LCDLDCDNRDNQLITWQQASGALHKQVVVSRNGEDLVAKPFCLSEQLIN